LPCLFHFRTQVVSDFLTPSATSDPQMLLRSMNEPIVVYTYKMAFTQPAAAGLA